MPNPTRISLPRVNYNFDAKACVPVLTVMLNKVEKDYSTVDELCDHDELSKFTRDEIKNAVSELNGRKFLLKVDRRPEAGACQTAERQSYRDNRCSGKADRGNEAEGDILRYGSAIRRAYAHNHYRKGLRKVSKVAEQVAS